MLNIKSPNVKLAATGLAALTVGLSAVKCARMAEGELSVRPEVPQSFTVQERYLTIGTDFILKDDQGAFGIIAQKHFQWSPSFEYKDANDSVLAVAKQNLMSWGVQIPIYDGSGSKIGQINEKVMQSLFKVNTTYEIENSSGQTIGTSEKIDIFGTDFTIRDNNGNTIAHISRDAFDLGKATWSVNIESGNSTLDNRLFIFIPAYKTYIDNKRSEDSSTNSDSKSNSK